MDTSHIFDILYWRVMAEATWQSMNINDYFFNFDFYLQ
jgi:hypothetical protein